MSTWTPDPDMFVVCCILTCWCALTQGGDTRREEVLSKVLVDISIHTTSHASDTAQNKLCSFWMGPVLLWSVINQKKDDLTIIDGSSLFKFVTER